MLKKRVLSNDIATVLKARTNWRQLLLQNEVKCAVKR